MSATRPWPGNRSRPRVVVGLVVVGLCVPVGGGPAPRATRASRFLPCVNLRLGVVDLEARPSPAAAHRHLGQVPQATRASRFLPCVNLRLGVVDLEARPGPPASRITATIKRVQVPGRSSPHRWGFSLLCTSHPGLAAHGHRRQAPQPGLFCPAAHALPSTPAVPGVLVGDRRRFEARPGPAPAHRHRSWAPAGGCMPCVGFQSGPLGGAALGAGWRRVAALMTRFPPF